MDEVPIGGSDRGESDTEGSGVGGSSSTDTGDARVDAILTLLHELDDEPVEEHAARYLEVHTKLSDELNPAAGPREAGVRGQA